ncbi:ATP-dependent sacrificial sulfur transferase LarE [Aeoliella mucimassa]|uniref:GMP synthase subunit B n=1 Tax=Aeoliella mucimassa TaxID=2527972 RepID=A0A518ANR8_9BACT|nr:ATP-dependent sacrificial sulfur transferase LarE [Aeoliella mucimassa]QDU56367.1 GMP synthase subunit B [Aeoliella mucimassa]
MPERSSLEFERQSVATMVNADSIAPELLAERLLNHIVEYESCAIAYSGGVDSAVVAIAAKIALGEQAIAITGVSPSLAEEQLANAREVASKIGIEHVEVSTSEINDPAYVANAPDRCFHCKSELYRVMGAYAEAHGIKTLVNGTILEDLGDYRPGLVAAGMATVRSPLAECKLDKNAVRALAQYWNLEVWDKPSSPCLASRIAYGQEVTPERLKMIDKAEQILHQLGLRECRVRYHEGDLARIEVPTDAIAELCERELMEWLVQEFTEIGFRYVSLDLAGFRSGSLNLGLPVLQ